MPNPSWRARMCLTFTSGRPRSRTSRGHVKEVCLEALLWHLNNKGVGVSVMTSTCHTALRLA